ncbi:ASCH domain-containing protein [Gemmata sp.]|uniref:ASCH domain-containing protein n=1 Tax=Gemmata sp. TaxID=1914242 RepID=UPI003F72B29B
MKCLSLHQPWASLMVSGAKCVETRGWPLRYRGPLLIHAAKKWDGDLAFIAAGQPFRAALERSGIVFEATEAAAKRGWGLPFGAIVGRVDVVNVVHTDDVADELGYHDGPYHLTPDGVLYVTETERAFGNFDPRRWAFLCENPVRFANPIPYRGERGLFEVPDELVRENIA